jgi:alpha-methylacyl-CoA racemase
MSKPLDGIRILDFSSEGPGTFASSLLADYGAEVVTVLPPEEASRGADRMYGRSKRSLSLNLKFSGAIELILGIANKFDVLIESMRPGKMEALGLGPEVIAASAPRLIYARLTAFGQTGPLSTKAGHDINAIAISGALSLCGIDQPTPPAALLGDFAGGSLMLVTGILLALIDRHRSGRGQIVDAAMSDGSTLLVGGMLPLHNRGLWGPQGTNFLDGSAPYYTTYQCADGKWIAVGAIERKFFTALIRGLNLEDLIAPQDQKSPEKAEFIRESFARQFRTKTRVDWEQVFDSIDACVSPVLGLSDLSSHAHHIARGSVYVAEEGLEAGVAPRLSACMDCKITSRRTDGSDSESILRELGISERELQDALTSGAVLAAPSSTSNTC